MIGIELGLTDPVSGLNMGETAEILAKEFDITREDQDRFAMESHQKAESAQVKCFASGEIVMVELPGWQTVRKRQLRAARSVDGAAGKAASDLRRQRNGDGRKQLSARPTERPRWC